MPIGRANFAKTLQQIPWRQLRGDLGRHLGAWPSVSLGLALAWLLLFAVVRLGFDSELTNTRAELRSAVEYFVQHPMVEVDSRMQAILVDVMPGYEGNAVFQFLNEKRDDEATANLQERVASAFGQLDGHPLRRLGLVPARSTWVGWVTHSHVHASWLGVLSGVLLLLLVGPLLERTWGHGAFAAVCVVGGIGAGALEAVVFPASDRVILGGSAILAVLAVAAVARFRTDNVPLLDWLRPVAEIELEVPAWVLPLVVGGAVAFEASARSLGLPASVDVSPGWVSAGFATLLGAGAALGIRASGLEERWGDVPEVQTSGPVATRSRFDLGRVERLRASGDLDAAWGLLDAEVARSARNRDVVTAYWELAVERGDAQRAAPAVVQLIREEVRRGALDAGAAHWVRLADADVAGGIDAPLIAKLLPSIRRLAGAKHVAVALEHAIPAQPGQARERGLTPRLAAQLAELAEEVVPELAAAAAEIALRGGDWSEGETARLAEIVKGASFKTDELPPIEVENVETAPDAFFAEQDRSSFGRIGDLGELAAVDPETSVMFPSARVAHAIPVRVQEDALALMVSGRGEVALKYERIRGVTAVGVKGLSDRPVVIVDLLMSGPDPGVGDTPLDVIRLQSDHFDPRTLVVEAGSPLEALNSFLTSVLKRARMELMAGSASATAGRLQMFPSLAAYERDVLRIKPE